MKHDPKRKGPQPPPQPGDPNLTYIGKYLRSSGVDELPQLLNVLAGEMSLVGPRPTVPYRAAAFTPQQRLRFRMKPGITGWALIHGRNALSWDEKAELDNEYIDQWSLALDWKILWKTLGVLMRREGIYMDPAQSVYKAEDDETL